jgi:hypothetical protein
MATDYILFVHGVKSRSELDFSNNTQALFQSIEKAVGSRATVKAIPCFWGNCGEPALRNLKTQMGQSSAWNKLWFKELRNDQILDFVGDVALYLSRAVGAQVVNCIYASALQSLQNHKPGDRLHLVTHSWGTVILLDLLFAKRWIVPSYKEADLKTWEVVQQIRNTLFGMGENPDVGLMLGSIHTMGSPIALFNLINMGEKNTHDLSPDLQLFLKALYTKTGKAVLWKNYIHPGDPIAYPLEGVSDEFLGQISNDKNAAVKVSDMLVKTNALSEKLMGVMEGNVISALYGGTAHNSYWTIPEISKAIAATIQG